MLILLTLFGKSLVLNCSKEEEHRRMSRNLATTSIRILIGEILVKPKMLFNGMIICYSLVSLLVP